MAYSDFSSDSESDSLSERVSAAAAKADGLAPPSALMGSYVTASLPKKAVVFGVGDAAPGRGRSNVEVVAPGSIQNLDEVPVELRVDAWTDEDERGGKGGKKKGVEPSFGNNSFILPVTKQAGGDGWDSSDEDNENDTGTQGNNEEDDTDEDDKPPPLNLSSNRKDFRQMMSWYLSHATQPLEVDKRNAPRVIMVRSVGVSDCHNRKTISTSAPFEALVLTGGDWKIADLPLHSFIVHLKTKGGRPHMPDEESDDNESVSDDEEVDIDEEAADESGSRRSSARNKKKRKRKMTKGERRDVIYESKMRSYKGPYRIDKVVLDLLVYAKKLGTVSSSQDDTGGRSTRGRLPSTPASGGREASGRGASETAGAPQEPDEQPATLRTIVRFESNETDHCKCEPRRGGAVGCSEVVRHHEKNLQARDGQSSRRRS